MPYKNRKRTSEIVQQRARELRQRMTPAERVLWGRLRSRQVGGFKFRRQHPLGPYIADFYRAEAKLVVELDGGIHRGQREDDAIRTAQFEAFRYRVLRFSNDQVLGNFDDLRNEVQEVFAVTTVEVQKAIEHRIALPW